MYIKQCAKDRRKCKIYGTDLSSQLRIQISIGKQTYEYNLQITKPDPTSR